ncbi:MAG: thioredoxin-disulfide reductase [Bacilli bacterium]|nr:thioredoxin-disulfide reductase [Bacilli bacterium]
MYDIIIIGAGIAGLTSAIYSLNANKKVLVLEKQSYGGQIITSPKVNNYPGLPNINGFDLATAVYNQAIDLGCEIKYEQVEKITKEKEVFTTKDKYQAKAIIIATGLVSNKLNIENEDNYIGKGISYCATCDGNFYKNKDVMVVGGGNTALEETLYLSDICNKVYLVHRRDEFRGQRSSLDKLKEKENVEIITNSQINKIYGNDLLEEVEIINNNSELRSINISGLFIAVGKVPSNVIFKDIIELNENGYIKDNSNCHTNVEGIFVAGDVKEKNLRQLVTAASDGAIAAIEAIKHLNN